MRSPNISGTLWGLDGIIFWISTCFLYFFPLLLVFSVKFFIFPGFRSESADLSGWTNHAFFSLDSLCTTTYDNRQHFLSSFWTWFRAFKQPKWFQTPVTIEILTNYCSAPEHSSWSKWRSNLYSCRHFFRSILGRWTVYSERPSIGSNIYRQLFHLWHPQLGPDFSRWPLRVWHQSLGPDHSRQIFRPCPSFTLLWSISHFRNSWLSFKAQSPGPQWKARNPSAFTSTHAYQRRLFGVLSALLLSAQDKSVLPWRCR